MNLLNLSHQFWDPCCHRRLSQMLIISFIYIFQTRISGNRRGNYAPLSFISLFYLFDSFPNLHFICSWMLDFQILKTKPISCNTQGHSQLLYCYVSKIIQFKHNSNILLRQEINYSFAESI